MKYLRLALALLLAGLATPLLAAESKPLVLNNGAIRVGTGASLGVYSVRQSYAAVPDGSTDNTTQIAAAFTAANSFDGPGSPTVMFDCDTGLTACEYNYGGTGTSVIHPTRAMTILCTPGVTLNYTGTGHAADIGPDDLTQNDTDRYAIQGCTWKGGASYTDGIVVNNLIVDTLISQNVFTNFGNRTGYTLHYLGNNWEPLIQGNYWRDTDGLTKNMIDARGAVNPVIEGNTSECSTSMGTACSVSTVGVGIWLLGGHITNNTIQFHYPLIRISSCNACASFAGLVIDGNHLEGNYGGLSPAITYGDPGTTGIPININPIITNNYFFFPVATGVPFIGPETPSSGGFFLTNAKVTNNHFSGSMGNELPFGGAAFFDTQGGPVVWGQNTVNGGVIVDNSALSFSTTGAHATESVSTNNVTWLPGVKDIPTNSSGQIAAFNASSTAITFAGFTTLSATLLCTDTGTADAKVCATAVQYDGAGNQFTPVAGTQIIIKNKVTNTTATTIAVNGLTAVNILDYSGTNNGISLAAGKMNADALYSLIYDGTAWELH